MTMSVKRGVLNFSSMEVDCLLDAVEEYLPIGDYEWDKVARLWQHFRHDIACPRNKPSLKRKFACLYRKRRLPQDPDRASKVLRARSIYRKIMDKIDEKEESAFFGKGEGHAKPDGIARIAPPENRHDDSYADGGEEQSEGEEVGKRDMVPDEDPDRASKVLRARFMYRKIRNKIDEKEESAFSGKGEGHAKPDGIAQIAPPENRKHDGSLYDDGGEEQSKGEEVGKRDMVPDEDPDRASKVLRARFMYRKIMDKIDEKEESAFFGKGEGHAKPDGIVRIAPPENRHDDSLYDDGGEEQRKGEEVGKRDMVPDEDLMIRNKIDEKEESAFFGKGEGHAKPDGIARIAPPENRKHDDSLYDDGGEEQSEGEEVGKRDIVPDEPQSSAAGILPRSILVAQEGRQAQQVVGVQSRRANANLRLCNENTRKLDDITAAKMMKKTSELEERIEEERHHPEKDETEFLMFAGLLAIW